MGRKLALTLLLLARAAQADPHVLRQDPAVSPPHEIQPYLTQKQLNQFLGTNPVDQDPPWDIERNFAYLEPNEHGNHVNENCLTPGGAYISVGTFRGMNVAASGKISHLVLVDINEGTYWGNQIILQNLERSSDRLNFLSRFLTGKSQPELEAAARKPPPEGLPLMKFVAALEDVRLKSPTKVWENWKQSGMEFTPDQLKAFAGGGKPPAYQSEILKAGNFVFKSELERFEALGATDKTIWGSDERFNNLKRMLSSSPPRITALTGNVFGDKTIANLAKALKDKNIEVSGYDLSNVTAYNCNGHYQSISPPAEQAAKDCAKIFSNARLLPFKKNGRIFLTDGNAKYSAAQPKAPEHLRYLDGWGYFGLRHDLVEKTFPDFDGAPASEKHLPAKGFHAAYLEKYFNKEVGPEKEPVGRLHVHADDTCE